MAGLAIEVTHLVKSYGELFAVRGIDLEVRRGEVYALLGPNGAGKTTTVEILEGHRRRTSGSVSVLGFDPEAGGAQFKSRIGIVLQEKGVDPYLTVEEAIDMQRGYYPHPRPRDEVIDVVGLAGKRKERVIRLSGGQQRRLDVAIGLAGDPELLFLDEPTTGFDPSARRSAWNMIGNLRALGKTVFLTTHYMDEAENLADRAAIIASGTIVAEGPPRALGGRETSSTHVDFRLPPGAPALPASLAQAATDVADGMRLVTDRPLETLHELTGWALHHRVELHGLNVSRPSLEDVYLRLTGAGPVTETNT